MSAWLPSARARQASQCVRGAMRTVDTNLDEVPDVMCRETVSEDALDEQLDDLEMNKDLE